jgi:hypothetical protein
MVEDRKGEVTKLLFDENFSSANKKLGIIVDEEIQRDAFKTSPPKQGLREVNKKFLDDAYNNDDASGSNDTSVSDDFSNISLLYAGATNNIINDNNNYEEHVFYNTYSFHLQAVVALTTVRSNFHQRHIERLQKWIMPIASALLAMIQLLILYWLIFEASHPTCSMHSDCNIGEYCDNTGGIMGGDYTSPRCSSCHFLNTYYEDHANSSCKAYEQMHENTLVWISGDGNYHPEDLNNFTSIGCLISLHCDRTDTGSGKCDYLDLNLTKITWPNVIVFNFVALLFAAHLYKDIKESMVEESLLDHALAKTSRTHHSATRKRDIQALAWVVRLTLRMRKFVLPWSVTAASTTIIVVESLSAKNILLNLLAVAFITEVDNIFGNLFLSDNQKRLAQAFVNKSKGEVDRNEVSIPSMQLRILGIMPAFVMVAAVLRMDQLLHILSSGDDCSEVSIVVGVIFCIFCPLVGVLIESVVHFFTDKNPNKLKRIISATLQICQNTNAILLSMVIYFFAIRAMFGSNTVELYEIGMIFLVNITSGFLLSRPMENIIKICIGLLLSGLYLLALFGFFLYVFLDLIQQLSW